MARIRYDHSKREWMFLKPEDESNILDITIDGYFLDYLFHVKKKIRNDFDEVIVISGAVGSGKSTLARLSCRVVSDERFNPTTHIVRFPADIKPVLKRAQRYDGIIFDEGSGIFSAVDTMTKKSKMANYVLDVCRQKNLFICIVAPNFHRLTSAVAVDRSSILARTYVDNRTGRRGRFAFYGTRAKERLYRFAKANYGSMKGVSPKFRGTFGMDETFLKEYKKVKDDTLNAALDAFDEKKESPPSPDEILRKHNVSIVKQHMDKPIEQMADLLNVSRRTLDRYRKEARELLALEKPNNLLEKQLNPTPDDTAA